MSEGPQVVTRHGEAVVVVLSAEEYRQLKGHKADFKEYLDSSPDFSLLNLERPEDRGREVAL